MQVPARLVVALLTLLALVLSGCGGGDGSSTSPGTATLLADAFGAGKPTRSGRIDLMLDVRARGLPNLKGPLVVHVTGPFQSTGAGRAPKFAFDLGLTSGAAKVEAGVISTGDKGYLTFAERAYALPAGALRSLGSGQGGAGLSLRGLGIDPRRWLRGAPQEADADLARAQACAGLVGQ